MVQVLKDSVKNQITAAAETCFATDGFKKATINAIASQAGVATGTIYTYFKDKKRLFQAIVTPEFAEEFRRLTRKRIEAFAQPDGLDPQRALLSGEAGDLLRFWIQNRRKVIILLARSEGSEYEGFARDYVQNMASQTVEQARSQFPDMEITDLFVFMVNKYLADSVRGIVSILERFSKAEDIIKAFAASAAYQIAGINAFIKWCRTAGR